MVGVIPSVPQMPTSSAQVRAVIAPTPSMLLKRSTRCFKGDKGTAYLLQQFWVIHIVSPYLLHEEGSGAKPKLGWADFRANLPRQALTDRTFTSPVLTTILAGLRTLTPSLGNEIRTEAPFPVLREPPLS